MASTWRIDAKDSMRRRYKLRKNCANTIIIGNSMLEYAREQLSGGYRSTELKGNTMLASV